MLEEIGEFVGRLVPVGRGVDAIGKVLPIPALQAALRRTKELTERQKKQDGTRVVKVSDVISIIDSELRGFQGGINEIGDFLTPFLPPLGPDAVSVVDRIEKRVRDAALGQKNPRMSGKFLEHPVKETKVGHSGEDNQWKQGFGSGHTYRTQIRIGRMHFKQGI